jgi:hypothetical protein
MELAFDKFLTKQSPTFCDIGLSFGQEDVKPQPQQ